MTKIRRLFRPYHRNLVVKPGVTRRLGSCGFLGVWTMLMLLGGCAGLHSNAEPPRLTVAGLKLVDVTLFEQTYQLKLRVQNPNGFDLPVEGLAFRLWVNGKPFASGVANRPVTIPAYGTEFVEVEGVGTVTDVLSELLELRKGIPDKLRYRLLGHVRLKNSPVQLPFDYSGEKAL